MAICCTASCRRSRTRARTSYGAGRQAGWRYIFELAEAVRAAVPRGMPLGARITGSDWAEGGLTPDDAVEFAAGCAQAGLDYVDVSSGGVAADIRNPTTAGYNVPMAERVRREAGIATPRGRPDHRRPSRPKHRERPGKADMVALGRALPRQSALGLGTRREALGAEVARPQQYLRVAPKLWPRRV